MSLASKKSLLATQKLHRSPNTAKLLHPLLITFVRCHHTHRLHPPPHYSLHQHSLYPIMKSFQAVIIAAIVASSAAINEPVASPTAAIERELAAYERQLGTDVTAAPTDIPGRSMVSYFSTVSSIQQLMDRCSGVSAQNDSSSGGDGSLSFVTSLFRALVGSNGHLISLFFLCILLLHNNHHT